MQNDLTQKQIIFCMLYENWRYDGNKYLAPHEFMGEKLLRTFNKYYFVSYEANSRLSEIHKANHKLLEKIEVIGKSGARYDAHRLRENVIEDPKLKEIYKHIKAIEKSRAIKKYIADNFKG